MTDFDEETKRKILKKSDGVRAAIRKFLKELSVERAAPNLEKISQALAELEKETPGGTPATDIESFFRTVGDGIVAAQTTLDERSRRYLQERPGHAVPSVYRIPKASAEISFAMKRESAEKFSVLVFSSGDSREQSQQHKVSFDIMAAPPPPDVMSTLERPLIELSFVADLGEREQVSALMRQYARNASSENKARVQKWLAEKAYRRTVVARGRDHWLLMRPVKVGGKPSLDVVRVARGEPADVIFEDGDPPANVGIPRRLRHVVAFIAELSQRQEEQLGRLAQRGVGE